MGKRVVCYIQAYDCEEAVEAAMQSVLDQTYENWLCVVLSNGNKNTVEAPNRTYDVIKRFAAKDRRFIVLNKRDNSLLAYIQMLYHLGQCFPDGYVCALDADDVYKNDFFERAVSFAEEYDLGIVACGTELILKERMGAEEKALLGSRQVGENTVIRETEYTDRFTTYKPFFNELWGKMYRASVLIETDKSKKIYPRRRGITFVTDSLFALNILTHSPALGILSGTSHKFFQYEERKATNGTNAISMSIIRKAARRFALLPVYRTYQIVMTFLDSHGTVGGELYEYMQAVLFGWLNDFYARVLLQIQNERVFANVVLHMVFSEKFDELMLYRDSGKYNNLRGYEKRKEYCELLYRAVLCRGGVRNRRILWEKSLRCSAVTRRKLDRIAAKLEATVRTLSELQENGGTTC